MQRRLVLTGFAALAVSPALAQSSPPPPTDAPAAPAAPAATMAPAPAPAEKIAPPLTKSDAATAHMTDTMKVGSLSLLTSRIAAPKVRHAALKQFTGFEIAEQDTIADILKAMMMPGATPSGNVMKPTDAELMGNVDDRGKALVGKMHEMAAGAEFDRGYLKVQIEGHKMLLDIQETYLKAPDGLDETNVAKLAKAMIEEHLILLGDIEKQLKA